MQYVSSNKQKTLLPKRVIRLMLAAGLLVLALLGALHAVQCYLGVNVCGIVGDEYLGQCAGSDVAGLELTDTGQTAIDKILKDALSSYDQDLQISTYRRITEDQFLYAMEEQRNDPWNFFLDTEVNYKVTTFDDGSEYISSISIAYNCPVNEIPARKAQLVSAVNEALSWIDDSWSDVEKAQALHDYLVRTCAYPQDMSGGTAYDALVERSCVCQGYSLAYQLLLEEAGIPCEFVISTDMNHGWNMVEIDGSWYHVDVTFDDAQVTYDGIIANDRGFDADVSHDYFLISDTTITDKGHYGWSSSNVAPEDYPAYDYPVYDGPVQ